MHQIPARVGYDLGAAMGEHTLLLVDDEPVMLVLVEKSLEAPDRAFVTATSGPQALAAAATRPPDLVVLDVLMPEMDGLQVCRTLRERTDTAATPIVFLSAKASRADVEAGLAAGANAYVVKPFDPDDLRATVARLLKP